MEDITQDITNNSTSMDNETELPTAIEMNRELFLEEVDKLTEKKANNAGEEAPFDVDQFLMQNNLNFVPLDTLIRKGSDVSVESRTALLDQITSQYDEYLEFCSKLSIEDSGMQLDLQRIKTSIQTFQSQINRFYNEDMVKTREVVTDSLEYAKELDNIKDILAAHLELHQCTKIGRQLSEALHQTCAFEPVEELICSDLIRELDILVKKSNSLLQKVTAFKSPQVDQFKKDHISIVQKFQVSLKILVQSCIDDPKSYPLLSKTLVSLVPREQ